MGGIRGTTVESGESVPCVDLTAFSCSSRSRVRTSDVARRNGAALLRYPISAGPTSSSFSFVLYFNALSAIIKPGVRELNQFTRKTDSTLLGSDHSDTISSNPNLESKGSKHRCYKILILADKVYMICSSKEVLTYGLGRSLSKCTISRRVIFERILAAVFARSSRSFSVAVQVWAI